MAEKLAAEGTAVNRQILSAGSIGYPHEVLGSPPTQLFCAVTLFALAACTSEAVDSVCAGDDDCPGTEVCVDALCQPDDCPGCVCRPGRVRDCGEPDGRGGILTEGECIAGLEVCNPEGQWDACSNAVRPMPEQCNERDDDCDGTVDEEALTRCWTDGDGDGFALSDATAIEMCGECPSNTTTVEPLFGQADCDDVDANRAPGLPDECDGVDADCSSAEATDPSEDADGDGHASADAPCTGGFPKDDCDDTDEDAFPGQTAFFSEARNGGGFDYDCNGMDELEKPATGECSAACSPLGWRGSVPPCGVTGQESRCRRIRFSCINQPVVATQSCR